jgi:hypothetical protein
MFDWLIDYLRFYVPLKKFSFIWRRHHCRWRAANFRPMLQAQDLWAGRDLYRATPAVTRDLGCSGLIRRTAPFSRLLRHTKGCGGSILIRILTGETGRCTNIERCDRICNYCHSDIGDEFPYIFNCSLLEDIKTFIYSISLLKSSRCS